MGDVMNVHLGTLAESLAPGKALAAMALFITTEESGDLGFIRCVPDEHRAKMIAMLRDQADALEAQA